MAITEIPNDPRPPRCQRTGVDLRNGRCADCKRAYERWYCRTRRATDPEFLARRRILATTGAARRKAERDAASAGQPNSSNSRNKHKYCDFLELIGKTDMAERIRASSLAKWAELEPRAMAWLADQLAAKRPRPTQREKAQEQPSAAPVRPTPTPTGDAIVDLVRRRAAGLS